MLEFGIALNRAFPIQGVAYTLCGCGMRSSMLGIAHLRWVELFIWGVLCRNLYRCIWGR